jgi:hypothetical protein
MESAVEVMQQWLETDGQWKTYRSGLAVVVVEVQVKRVIQPFNDLEKEGVHRKMVKRGGYVVVVIRGGHCVRRG